MTVQDALATSPQRMLLTVDDFLLLDQAGALAGYAKMELIEGEIFVVNSQYRPHAYVKSELAFALRAMLERSASGLHVIVEGSISLSAHDVPEPDIVLTNEPYGQGFIPGSSVALIVEVSDSSLSFDLGRKAALYAGAGVAEYWVANVTGKVLIQMWSPDGATYRRKREIAFGLPIEAATIVGLRIDTQPLTRAG